ncbi:hypothetical protein HDK64DRAFT_255719 [Phyllosticta capitalensis]|uniref:Uncharacterized protein n=1 Tax=Phyllosticta capitalensis TaxID=121624 RepID=A0ABR1YI16_9PEZI
MAAAAAAAVDPLVGAGAVGWSVVAATIARFGICKRGGDDGGCVGVMDYSRQPDARLTNVDETDGCIRMVVVVMARKQPVLATAARRTHQPETNVPKAEASEKAVNRWVWVVAHMISEVLGIATEDLGIDIGNGNGTEDLGIGTEDLGRCRGQEPQGAVDSADRCIQQHLTTQGQKSARLRTVYKRAATPSASMSSKYISATPNSSSEQVRRAKRDKQAPQQRFPSFASPWRACRRRRAREPMAISHGTLSYIMQCDQTMRLALWPPRQVGRLFGGVAAAVDSAATCRRAE